MDIVLVQCKPQNELYDSRYQSENLALGYLAASLRRAGFKTKVIDAHLLEMGPEETVAAIIDHSPWLVGFSSSAQDSIRSTFHVVERLRTAGYAGHVTVGGHFPTYEHQQLLEHNPGIDSVVRGEGEITLVELASRVQVQHPLESVTGITYRAANDSIIVNPDRPLVDDLDSLPIPDRDTMQILLDKNRRISMLSSRGCYAKCSFCSIQTFFNWRPRRVRSTQHVVAEMRELYDQGVRKFKFVDDLFMDPSKRSRDWVLELCDRIRESGMHDLNLWLQVRAVCVTEEIMTALRDIGLKKIFLGLESGHAETLKRYRKEITPEQNLEAVRILQKVGIPEVSIGMMIFEPDVLLEGIRENVEFLKQIGTFDIRDVTGRFLPYAGTPLTEQLLQEGRIRRTSWHDIGTYDFLDPKVGQLFRMVSTYNKHATPSLKLIYKMDSQIRKLERHFLHQQRKVDYFKLLEQYKNIRRQVELFIQEHGKLMLSLVEDTIEAVGGGLAMTEEESWYQKSCEMFAVSESETGDLFAQIAALAAELQTPVVTEQASIHVAAVKVLPRP